MQAQVARVRAPQDGIPAVDVLRSGSPEANADGRMALRRSRVVRMAIVAAFLLGSATWGANALQAQEPSTAVPPSAAESTPPVTPSSPVPSTVPTESPLAPQIQIPDFHLAQVSIDAEAVKDRVNVDVVVEVVINQGEGWHRIPLRLGQGHVWKRTYTGPGEEVPDTNSRTTDEGISWLIRGVGKHQLRLSMWVPLRRTALGTQFQLSLPPLPPQFESQLKLRIPDASAVLRASKNLTLLGDITRTETQTVVQASVSGRMLDVTWHTPVVTGDVASHVNSLIQLKPGVEHLSLIATQSIDLQQAGTQSINVRLPSDFPQYQISGPQYLGHEPIPGRDNWVRVRIQDDGRNRVELRWLFERELPAEGGTVTIDGLQLEGAVQEEGKVRIDEYEGYRILPRRGEAELVHRIGVNQVRLLGSGTPQTAYEFVKQPFRLVLDVTPTLPYFTVDPVCELSFLDDQIELKVHNLVRFDRGGISELEMHWKNYEADGWRVVSASSNLEQTGRPRIEATGALEVLKLVWSNSISRDVRLTSVFRRPLPESLDAPIGISLPMPQSPRIAPAVVIVTAADKYEFAFRSLGDDFWQRVEKKSIDAWKIPQSWGETSSPETDQSTRYYRLADWDAPLEVQLTIHQREVQASTVVEIMDVSQVQIDEMAQETLSVRQTISFDVRFGRLNEVNLVIPSTLLAKMPQQGLTEALDASLDGNLLMVMEVTGGVLKAILPTARKGRFDVHVEYRFPIDGGDDARNADLPYLTLAETPYATTQCYVMPYERVQVRGKGTSWSAVRTSPRGGAVWIRESNGDPQPRVPLTVGRRLVDSAQRFVVDKAIIRTRFTQNGSALSWAEYQLVSPPLRLLMEFPADTIIKGFLIDGEPLAEADVQRRTEQDGLYSLTLPPRSTGTRSLVVQYESQLTAPFSLAREQTVQFPRFWGSVWVDQTIWEVHLPDGHHLFTYPGLDPQFEWVRHIAAWRRDPKPTYLAEREVVLSTPVPPEFAFEPQTFYPFRGFGPVSEVSFRSMNRSLILLIGAGFTLLLGFTFWKLPATRNVFSLVVIAFLFAAASLWYLEPLLLLLQPAILGVALALTATVVDSLTRRPSADPSSMRGSKHKLPHLDDVGSENVSTRIYQPVSVGDSQASNR